MRLESLYARKGFADEVDLPEDPNELAKIEKCLKDYRDFDIDFLSDLERRKFLLDYRINYQFLSISNLIKIRTIILVWTTDPDVMRNLLRRKDVKEHILEVYKGRGSVYNFGVTPDDLNDYTNANAIIISEFNDIAEYNKWIDNFYELTETNCFTSIVKKRYSESPMTLGGYYEFNKICNSHIISEDKGIKIGRGVWRGEKFDPKTDVGLELDSFRYHGLIAGQSGSGKTNTGRLFVERASSKGIGVHILDIKPSFEEYPEEDKENFLKETPLKDIKGQIKRFNIKTLNEKELVDFIKRFFDKFDKTYGSSETKMNHIILIDELISIGTDNNRSSLMEPLRNALRTFREKGIGIICLSQKINDFIELGYYGSIKNKIIHRLEPIDNFNVLWKTNSLGIYEFGFESDVIKLDDGHAYAWLVTEKGKRKPLIKIHFDKIK